MENLVQDIYQLLKDYRADENIESVKITPERIERWILQFEEEDRVFLLTELKNIFFERYFSKQKVLEFLKGLIYTISKKLGYTNPSDFLDNTSFLDLQPSGKSQKKMLEILKQLLLEEFSYPFNRLGNSAKKHYIYIDDVLCTGSTFYNNLKDWFYIKENGLTILERIKNKEINLINVYIFIVKKNYYKKRTQFLRETKENLASLQTSYAIHWLENEDLKPIQLNQSDLVIEYERKIIQQVDEYVQKKYDTPSHFYRFNDSLPTEIYTSPEARMRFENILLKKGIEILNTVSVKKNNIRALGYSLPSCKDFGFGALLFTWRNVPNNTPLVFWYAAGGFEPLFSNVRPPS